VRSDSDNADATAVSLRDKTRDLGELCKVGLGCCLQLDLGRDLDLVGVAADDLDRAVWRARDDKASTGPKIEFIGLCRGAFQDGDWANAAAERKPTRNKNNTGRILLILFS
jgi:hypothetical protein